MSALSTAPEKPFSGVTPAFSMPVIDGLALGWIKCPKAPFAVKNDTACAAETATAAVISAQTVRLYSVDS
jgi:hypothetical protein